MDILLVGAGGTLGRAVGAALAPRHRIVAAGRSGGDVRLDLTDRTSVERALDAAGPYGAVISAAGNAAFAPLLDLDATQWALGLHDKLMGQIGLALAAAARLRDGGSITLTSGFLNREPVRGSVPSATANGAIEAFVRSAALELPRGLRINAVSPGLLTESVAVYGDAMRGFEPVPAARVALGYVRSVEGADTGRVYRY